jgi:hypothetical protein
MAFRIDPQTGPEAYKTYQIVAPRSTHYRPATCREVECDGYRNGFRTIVPADSLQAQYIRAKSGRAFVEQPGGPGLAEFSFAPGQQCFRASEHRIALDREPFYVVRDGDYRGNPFGTRPLQRRAVDWVDDFATHQQNVADARQRG